MSEEAVDVVGPVGMTDYELVALVDMDETPQARRALEAMGLADLLGEPTAVRAGYCSLLVRDIAGLDDRGIVARGAGAAIGEMMAAADDILLLELTRDGVEFGRSVLVDAAIGSFLLDQTDLGVHAAQPLEPSVDPLTLLREVLEEFVAAEDPDGPFEAAITRFPVDGEPRPVLLRIESSTDWRAVGLPAGAPDGWDGAQWRLGLSDAEAASGARRAH